MNNKGFTLVELLAVIIILLALARITMFGITSILENQDRRQEEQQKELACGAAKIYFSTKDLDVTNTVSVATLISGEYFSSTSKTDKIKDKTLTINKNTKIISFVGDSDFTCP